LLILRKIGKGEGKKSERVFVLLLVKLGVRSIVFLDLTGAFCFVATLPCTSCDDLARASIYADLRSTVL